MSVCLSVSLCLSLPDITVMVDWAQNTKLLTYSRLHILKNIMLQFYSGLFYLVEQTCFKMASIIGRSYHNYDLKHVFCRDRHMMSQAISFSKGVACRQDRKRKKKKKKKKTTLSSTVIHTTEPPTHPHYILFLAVVAAFPGSMGQSPDTCSCAMTNAFHGLKGLRVWQVFNTPPQWAATCHLRRIHLHFWRIDASRSLSRLEIDPATQGITTLWCSRHVLAGVNVLCVSQLGVPFSLN